MSKKTIKAVEKTDTIISKYNGTSIRKWAEDMKKAGNGLPKMYYYNPSHPLRRDGDGNKVIIEGKWRLGCYWKGQPIDFGRFTAGLGYKLPCSGSLERCKELFLEYKSALGGTGKYAKKTGKAGK